MKIQTEIRVLTRRVPQPCAISFLSGLDAMTTDQDENLGYHHNGVTEWYSKGELIRTSREPQPGHVTLPRIQVVGSDKDILDQIQSYAGKMVEGFGITVQHPEWTLYLIDLWGESNSVTGRSNFDIAMMVSPATFDWSLARKVPSYLGWTGLEVPDLPVVVRKSRYKRDPVI